MLCTIISVSVVLYICYRLYEKFYPSPNINPNDKCVLISGCDTGFGHELAVELDKIGFNVYAGIYSIDNKDRLKQRLSNRATIFKLDITKQDDIDAAFNMISSQTKTLHALVNNAGIATSGIIDWITVNSMRRIMDVNFFGHVAMTKKFLPLLISKRDSRVVNICSVAGIIAAPSMSAYAASKYAFESFSDCLRREMAVWGLRVCIVEPSFMKTALINGHDEALKELWDTLTDDVKQRWGEAFLNKQIEEISSNFFMKNAESPKRVVDALKHGVMSTTPRIRYRPGWQSSTIMFFLSICPAWLTDILIDKSSKMFSVTPAGVNKQLPE